MFVSLIYKVTTDSYQVPSVGTKYSILQNNYNTIQSPDTADCFVHELSSWVVWKCGTRP